MPTLFIEVYTTYTTTLVGRRPVLYRILERLLSPSPSDPIIFIQVHAAYTTILVDTAIAIAAGRYIS
jgi:hypothetical protein